jgi:hypothetical protein
MLDSGLLSKNFIGRDGFIWWIGQVPDAKSWSGNLPTLPQKNPSDLSGFKYRVKVRILGYHTSDLKNLPDQDLPWALVMMPTTSGSGSGSNYTTPRFSGGEFVFGFFLDGDNGQQPVIIGILGNSTQTLLSKSLPSVGFKPFTGHTNGKSIPPHELKASKQIQKDGTPNGPQVPTGSKGGTPNTTVSATIPNPSNSPNPEGPPADISRQHSDAQQKDNKEYPLGNACKKDKKKKSKIKSAIKNLIRAIKGIQKSYDTYVATTANTISNITSEISECSGLINSYLQKLINDFRSWLFTEINKKLKKLLSKISIKKQTESAELQQKTIDTLGCVFDRLMDGLYDLIKSFLERMIDRILSASQCIIDNMIGALLNSIIGPLESAISAALGPLNAFLSGLPGGLENALNFASALEKFLSCEKEDECPEVEVWSWLDGPRPADEDNFIKELNSVGKTASTGLSNFLGNSPGVIPTAGSIGECLGGFGVCGPPNIQIFGGGGTGATANAIIGPSGEILAASILSTGIEYYSNPFVYFDDPCGNGSGAKAEAIVGTDGNDCGKIVAIRIIDGGQGYLKRSDGSLGSEGETSVGIGSDANAVILPNGADFSIDFGTFGFNALVGLVTTRPGISTTVLAPGVEIPCGITTAYPSLPISVLPGATVNLPPGAAVILSPSMEPITTSCSFTKSNTTYTFPGGCEITIPQVITPTPSTVGVTTTLPIDDYNVVLELDEIVIRNTGINYSPEDKICCNPDNGANLEPQFDQVGRLVGVRILNKGAFVTERPTITICESKTGVNAEMFAVLKVTDVSNLTKQQIQQLGFNQDKLVSVIDCVGKV